MLSREMSPSFSSVAVIATVLWLYAKTAVTDDQANFTDADFEACKIFSRHVDTVFSLIDGLGLLLLSTPSKGLSIR